MAGSPVKLLRSCLPACCSSCCRAHRLPSLVSCCCRSDKRRRAAPQPQCGQLCLTQRQSCCAERMAKYITCHAG